MVLVALASPEWIHRQILNRFPSYSHYLSHRCDENRKFLEVQGRLEESAGKTKLKS